MISFPLNDIPYNADALQLYCATRGTGIYTGEDFRCTVKGNDNKVTVEAGMGWCRFDRYRGCAFALKEAQTVDLGTADENLPRIDAVGVKYFSNGNKFDIFIEKGTPASKPIAPTIDKSLGVILCLVDRPASTSIITADLITDVRLNTEYCGLMADAVTTVDTVAIDQQITKFLDDLKDNTAFVLREEMPNYIIEETRNGVNGIIKKYLNGDAEYWDKIKAEPIREVGIQTDNYVLKMPQALFIQAPLVVVTTNGVNSRGSIVNVNYAIGNISKDTIDIKYYDGGIKDSYFTIHAIGRWK